MTDDQIRQLISRYLDDQLDESQRREVEKLIAESEEYAEYYRQLQALAGQVDEFEIGGSDAYWEEQKEAVLDRIERAEEKKITRLSSGPMPALYKWLAVAASIVLVALISVNESQNIPWIKGMFEHKEIAPSVVLEAPSEKSDGIVAGRTDTDDRLAFDQETTVATDEVADEGASWGESQPSIQQDEDDLKSGLDVATQSPSPMPDIQTELLNEAVVPVEKYLESPESESRAEVSRHKTIPASREEATKTKDIADGSRPGEQSPSRERTGIALSQSEPTTATPGATDKYKADVSSRIAPKQTVPESDDGNSERMYWQNRLDSLVQLHGNILPKHVRESVAMSGSTATPDTSQATLMPFAETFYHLGQLSTGERERQGYLSILQALQNRADSTNSKTIATYIDHLRSLK